MRKVIGLLGVVWLVLGARCLVLGNEYSWQEIGRGNVQVKAVLVDQVNPKLIFMGTDKALFKTDDGGESWKNILSIRGQNQEVNAIAKQGKYLYVATGNGLYFSDNLGEPWSWKKIFKGKSYLESQCTSLAIMPWGIFLGTKAGFFTTVDNGRAWHKQEGKLGNGHILAVTSDIKEPDSIYVASIDGVFRNRNKGENYERIFVASSTENSGTSEEEDEGEDKAERRSMINYMSVGFGNIYIATTEGIYRSSSQGGDWEKLSNYGLLSNDVRLILASATSRVIAVTKSDIFEFKDGRWYELSFGLVAQEINSIAVDREENIYAACDRGLFKAKISSDRNNSSSSVPEEYFQNEPKINEIQQAAIKYAEVEPEKIIRWRKQAAKKAILPHVSTQVGRNVTDLWHWETGSTTKVDDDVLVKGNDALEWDITLSWDLSELIWTNDQTSIDTRSRLLVQLRDDILDEVTKLYFERIRVKMELDNLSIEDRKKRFDRELRLQELTASIDALTGGYFSKRLTRAK